MRIALLSLFMLAAMAMVAPTQQAEAASSIGKVQIMAGEVYAIRGNQKITLKRGDALYEGDQLETGTRSFIRAKLNGSEDNNVVLGQNSKLKVKSYKVTNSGEVTGGFFKALLGAITMSVSKIRSGSDFAFNTPTATMGVRGTKWGVVVNADGGYTMACSTGKLEVTVNGRKFVIQAGQAITTSAKGVVKVGPAKPGILKQIDDSTHKGLNETSEGDQKAAVDELGNAIIVTDVEDQTGEDFVATITSTTETQTFTSETTSPTSSQLKQVENIQGTTTGGGGTITTSP